MSHFDILGMDWLTKYQGFVFSEKKVTFQSLKGVKVLFYEKKGMTFLVILLSDAWEEDKIRKL